MSPDVVRRYNAAAATGPGSRLEPLRIGGGAGGSPEFNPGVRASCPS